VIRVAGINCCVLANNHVLDWGRAGLLETLGALERQGPLHRRRTRQRVRCRTMTVVVAETGRVLVFAFASPSAGVPLDGRPRPTGRNRCLPTFRAKLPS
jgi:poly-gamma-glutamate synthesis protein (capsule biosynthesis protein)